MIQRSNTLRRKMSHPKYEWDSSRFRPLRVRAYLSSGAVGDGYFPFDGLLMAARMQEILDIGHHKAIPTLTRDTEPIYISLPLERRGISGIERAPRASEDYYWAASWAVADWVEEAQSEYSKRLKTEYAEMIETPRKLPAGSGRYREYRIPVYYLLAHYVDWYVVGDPEEIEYLLTRWITSIGHKRGHGWGHVLRWEVAEVDHDWSEIKGNVLTRGVLHLSSTVTSDTIYREYGIRAPYWHPSTWRMLYMPVVQIGPAAEAVIGG